MDKIINRKLKLVSIRKSHANELFDLTNRNRVFLDKWLPG